ncbi:acyltransferase [Catellatospora vulcania]|uniref:acyltransferase n=1 Tax=Catellatospora vulcania TaxID=1460450 RepID=UPI002E7AD940|nr:acyltransferase [Catellatospora vulcania]
MSEFDFCPWLFADDATPDERDAQLAHQRDLPGLRRAGDRSFVSPLAAIHQADLTLGADSYLAAHVYLTGEVQLGDHTSLNPYAVVRGPVRLGSGVRVGAHASLVGFNHSADPDKPIHQQPIVAKGVVVGDDVWIGSNAIVLDGVTIGDHAVIGAGAVVTKDVAAWSVMVGNPARRIRDRRDRTRPNKPAPPLADFAAQARDQAAQLLDRHWTGETFTDQPGATPTVRAICDAVEIADLLLDAPPPQLDRDELVRRLAAMQDHATGLIPEMGEGSPSLDSGSAYHLLSVGYALDLLGARLPHPVQAVRKDPARLVAELDGLPWARQAWSAGAWVDIVATGLHWNRRLFDPQEPVETLFGWLLTRQDPFSGIWGAPSVEQGWQQPVNGYYRLTRGTFAQFGLPVPRPEQTIDTVLAHTRDGRYFADGRGTACDVLDVIHPLWLCGLQTRHRRTEVQAWARDRLAATLARWHTAAGFAFSPAVTTGTAHLPSLQGTEMWLAIIWLLADVLGESGALGYRPRGVHRPEPAPVVRTL